MSRLAVVGLGKLGACMAACFAARGFEVTGADLDPQPVDALAAGRPPVPEPGLRELLEAAGARLRATTRIAEAVAAADATFVVVPTPSLPDGRFALDQVRAALREIGTALRGCDRRHVVAITSTVLPGSMEHGIRPVLEEAAGRRCGDGLALCYNPEFIALGSVVRDFLRPDLVLIGESEPWAGDLIADVYRRTCLAPPEIARMSFASAELAKIALNAFITTKISFANMLVDLCEELPGADADDVCAALGRDRRIGERALRGGLGYGGPCFPRDSVALAALAHALGRPASIPEAADRVNHAVVERVLGHVRRALPGGGRVAVLGLAYKPGTPIVECSHGLEIARALAAAGVPVTVHDATASAAARQALADAVTWAATPAECVASADLVVLASSDRASAVAFYCALDGRTRPLTVLDCWRLLEPADLPAAVRHVALGVGEASPARRERLRSLWAEA